MLDLHDIIWPLLVWYRLIHDVIMMLKERQ